MSLLKDFEALCKYVRECTGDDIVCGLCEYDAGTVGEEQIECPGFESNECFVLKESLRKQYEMYDQVVRCKDCRYFDAKAKTMDTLCTRKQGCNDAPTVEAEPVRHGRWITDSFPMDDGEYLMERCTACGVAIEYGMGTPYCPFCGAKMEDEGEEE